MRREKALASLLALALASTVRAATDESSLLKLPLFPVPVVQQNAPLTRALSYVGAFVRNGYVLFGIEVRSKDDREPAVNVNLKPGSTLGDALRQIFQQVPGYTFDVVSQHLINVYPIGANRDPADLLNLRVPAFDAVDVYPGDILARPQDFMPEVRARLFPRKPGEPTGYGLIVLGGVGPTVTLHLRDVTVRQVLNAVSQETEEFPATSSPLGWVCYFRPNPTLPAGGTYRWEAHLSAPHDWKAQGKGESVK
jgi:hypothetical protein